MSKKILIIGAGPAGLAAAMELYNNNISALLVEKSGSVGGLAKTLTFKHGKNTFKTDIGPHRFYSKNKYLYSFIKTLLREKWILVPRRTRQYIDGKFYDYPIKPIQALMNIGVMRAALILFDYVVAKFQYGVLRKKINSFEDYIVANFGRHLGEFNMLNYTEKIWGISCDKISPDWGIQRIRGLSLLTTLMSTFSLQKKPKSLVEYFYYPSEGTGMIYEAIVNKIRDKSRILLNSYPIKVEHNGSRITGVTLKSRTGKIQITPDVLIESMPITEFIKILSPSVPTDILHASSKLKFRHQRYLFLIVNKKSITTDNWIYFPDKSIPFARISEMKNFSASMSPKNMTSLFVEYFCFEGDSIWKASDEQLLEMSMPIFEKLSFFTRIDIVTFHGFKNLNVYPIYDLNYKKYLKSVKKFLNKFENLLYVGRSGRFMYTNQDHSLEMGICAARSIIHGLKFDFDNVDHTYFEDGNLTDTKKK